MAAGPGPTGNLCGRPLRPRADGSLSSRTVREQPAEVSHQHSRGRERHMRRFKSAGQAQRFLAVHAAIGNAFRVARHRLQARHYRLCREQAFHTWDLATCGSSRAVHVVIVGSEPLLSPST